MQLPFFTAVILFASFFVISEAIDCKFNSNGKFSSKTVDISGNADFNNIQVAIDSIPPNNDEWVKIFVRRGTYLQKVEIPRYKECIILEGEGPDVTIISWNDHLRTDQSATFTVEADNFVARKISFKNSYNRALASSHLQEDIDGKVEITQAVAARLYGDKSAFHECGFLGFQDTLWDVTGRHYFNSCYIEGAIDFIFGSGQSFYEDSLINVTTCSEPDSINIGYITAQGRPSANDPSGFVFERGLITGCGRVYLGRAYGAFSRVIFHETRIDIEVVPEGWDHWGYPNSEDDFTHVELNCHGNNYDTSKRVKWMKKAISSSGQFQRTSFIDNEGWIFKQP